MIEVCGKGEISTHKRYPAVRINGTRLALVGTHKRYPLPCSGSCSWLPVEARSAVEGAQPFPPPGNPAGIPPPPTAAATAKDIRNRATGEPARTRQSEHIGITPKQCLQAVRLTGVRRDLRRSGAKAKIADVANRWEFWHMGQFAADYRHQFGELPSETLQRHNGAGRRSETPANIASTQLLSP